MKNKSSVTNHLSPNERRSLASWIGLHGEAAVREKIGVGKLPLARLLAGLRVQRATLTVARAQLQRFEEEKP